MALKIDHVTFGVRRLDTMVNAFTSAGLTPDYGGPHSNGVSHMSLLAFDDGSYVELISTLRATETAPTWGEFIREDGGACAWAVEASDIHAEATRLSSQNVTVVGPRQVTRKRPDGVLVEWDLAFVGDDGPGALQPFLIQDRTPRSFRVQPSRSVSGSELCGVGMVLIGVRDLHAAANVFKRDYGLADPRQLTSSALETTLLAFPDAPLALAAPAADGDWLDRRLQTFGNCPCGFVLRSIDMHESLRRFDLASDGLWLERELAWFNTPGLRGLRLGVMSE